jgi:hypothetical protein
MNKKLMVFTAVILLTVLAFAHGGFVASDLYIPAPHRIVFGEGSSDDAVLSGGADSVTLASGDTLAITTADKLTVGGVIVPQQIQATFADDNTPDAADRVFFIANAAYQVTGCVALHSVAAGGASKLQVVKDTSTNAPGAGTDLLTNNTNAGFDLNATANTLQTGTLTATEASLQLASGDRLSVDFADAIQSSVGVAVTCYLKRI